MSYPSEFEAATIRPFNDNFNDTIRYVLFQTWGENVGGCTKMINAMRRS